MIELTVLNDNNVDLNTVDDGLIGLDVVMATGGGSAPTLQTKSVTYTPTESAQTSSVLPDVGYDGLSKVDVTVGAIDSEYVGSNVPRKSSSDLTASGATVNVPAGYYSASASKSVASGTEGTPTATKGAVSNHSVSVTPSVTNNAGYISGGTKTGSAVSVSASELVSGTKNITISANGTTTEDVTNYASASITANVPNSYSASDEGKVVSSGALVAQTSDTVTANDTYDTTLINSLTVNVSGGGGTAPLYPIGYNKSSNEYLEISGINGHVKFERYTNNSSDYYISLGLIGIGTSAGVLNNKPVWFTISAGATVVIKITNVVNSNGITWNMNFRKANAGTSLGYGIGNGTHINGENISITATSNDEVGTLFLYVAHGTIGVLEFDVEITVDGVRYI